jgi:hypothetical protein
LVYRDHYRELNGETVKGWWHALCLSWSEKSGHAVRESGVASKAVLVFWKVGVVSSPFLQVPAIPRLLRDRPGRKRQLRLPTLEKLTAAYQIEVWQLLSPAAPKKTALKEKGGQHGNI